MITPLNKVLVEIESFYQDRVDFLDTQLIVPQEGHLYAKQQIKGRVLCDIKKLQKDYRIIDNIAGHYHSDFHLEVDKGDIVYFYPIYCSKDNEVTDPDVLALRESSNSFVVLMPYEALFAKQVGVELELLNGCILVNPAKETNRDIVTESGIWLKPVPSYKLLQGELAYTSKSLKCYESFDEYDLEAGDYVYLATSSDFQMRINGTLYYLCRKTDVIAVVTHTPFFEELLESDVDRNESLMSKETLLPYGDRVAFRLQQEVDVKTVGENNRILDEYKETHSKRYDNLVYNASLKNSKAPMGVIEEIGTIQDDLSIGDRVVALYVEGEVNGLCFTRTEFIEFAISSTPIQVNEHIKIEIDAATLLEEYGKEKS